MALRAHMEFSVPILAAMMQQMPPQAGVTIPAGFDPAAPIIQMNQELVELSTAVLDDDIFAVPSGYLPVSMEEVLKGAASAPAPPQFKQ